MGYTAPYPASGTHAVYTPVWGAHPRGSVRARSSSTRGLSEWIPTGGNHQRATKAASTGASGQAHCTHRAGRVRRRDANSTHMGTCNRALVRPTRVSARRRARAHTCTRTHAQTHQHARTHPPVQTHTRTHTRTHAVPATATATHATHARAHAPAADANLYHHGRGCPPPPPRAPAAPIAAAALHQRCHAHLTLLPRRSEHERRRQLPPPRLAARRGIPVGTTAATDTTAHVAVAAAAPAAVAAAARAAHARGSSSGGGGGGGRHVLCRAVAGEPLEREQKGRRREGPGSRPNETPMRLARCRGRTSA